MTKIIKKLKKSGLTGKGGAGFPVWQKWQTVSQAKGDVPPSLLRSFGEAKKYIIANGSEGEPMIFKDKYILENYPAEVIDAIKIALRFLGKKSQAYIYLNSAYYAQFKEKLLLLIGELPILLFEEKAGYLGGEETTLLNIIEQKPTEPRIKPPFPTTAGLWGKPTLIQNIETLYWISKIAKGEYKGNRFYSIEGDIKNRGVFELPETATIEQVLRQTNNFPDFDFFIQAGGGAAGEILLPNELNKPLKGAGAILVYNATATDILSLMRGWAEFFNNSNCDKCLPCREGVYRILEIVSGPKERILQEKQKLLDILAVLEKTTFCPLGRMSAVPFQSALAKLL